MIIYCIRHDSIKWNIVQETIKSVKNIKNFEYIFQELQYEPFNKSNSDHMEILRIHTQNPSVIANHGTSWHFDRNMPIEKIAEYKQYYIIYINLVINSNHSISIPCGIFNVATHDEHSVYIAYTVDPIFQNCGIGTVMIEMIIEHIKTKLSFKIKRIYARVWSNNYGSQRILSKNGFILETCKKNQFNECVNEFAEWDDIIHTNSSITNASEDIKFLLFYTKKI